MDQAVSRRPVTAEDLVRSKVSACEICGIQSGSGTGFSHMTSFFPYQYRSTEMGEACSMYGQDDRCIQQGFGGKT